MLSPALLLNMLLLKHSQMTMLSNAFCLATFSSFLVAGFTEWIFSWLCHTRRTIRVSRELPKPELSGRIWSIWQWEWFYVSGLAKLSFSLLLYFARVLFLFQFPISQDYMAHGSQGLFTQVGFNEPSQEDASQGHFGVANANPLQSQVLYCWKECFVQK